MPDPCRSCDLATCSGSCTPMAYRWVSVSLYPERRGQACCILPGLTGRQADGLCQVRFADGLIADQVPRQMLRRVSNARADFAARQVAEVQALLVQAARLILEAQLGVFRPATVEWARRVLKQKGEAA